MVSDSRYTGLANSHHAHSADGTAGASVGPVLLLRYFSVPAQTAGGALPFLLCTPLKCTSYVPLFPLPCAVCQSSCRKPICLSTGQTTGAMVAGAVEEAGSASGRESVAAVFSVVRRSCSATSSLFTQPCLRLPVRSDETLIGFCNSSDWMNIMGIAGVTQGARLP